MEPVAAPAAVAFNDSDLTALTTLPTAALVVAASALLAAVAMSWLSTRGAPLRLRLGLFALRVLLVIGVFVVLLEPGRRLLATSREPDRVVVAVDDDGLLHTALSPLSSIPTRRDRVLTILAACAPCDVLLVIEDLAPRGLDPTAGIAFARDAVLITNAKRLYATAGTAWLPPLRDRKKGRSVDIEAHDLASAAWAVGRVDVEVYGVVRTAAPLDLVARKARQFGLAGFIVDERAAPQTPTTTPTSAPDPFESR